MAQSISPQSLTHHGIPHTHNTAQTLDQTTTNHSMQHPNSLHTNLTHTHPTHSASTSYQNHHRKSSHENDEEAIARKKKNADAQAAFRQRRQTYIKSLEDTVSELKGAVSEMEAIVKTTSNEAKHQRQKADYFQAKLNAYESGELQPGAFECLQHCKCCKFAPPDFNLRPHAPAPGIQHHAESLSTPTTSAITVSPAADCPTPTGPSILTSTVTNQDDMARDWPSRQGPPPIFQAPPTSRSTSHHHPSALNSPNDIPHSTTSLDHPRNILHQQHHGNSSLHHHSYPRPNCDVALFPSFGAPENSSISNYYPPTEANHASSSQSVGPDTAAGGSACPIEMDSHPHHLQPNTGHIYDRSPPLCQSHSLGNVYSPLGHSQSFDAHHSGTLSSPRMWHSNSPTYPSTEPNPATNFIGSSKPPLYPVDGSAADVESSGFRLQRGAGERSIMRPVQYLPSLELRAIPQSYPIVSTLSSPRADGQYGVVSSKPRCSMPNKRRWHDDKLGPNYDNHEPDDAPTSAKTGVKLNGIPAKVARCEQVCTEVSKVVSQMKEEVKAVTATQPPTTPSTVHQSVSPNAITSRTFSSPHNVRSRRKE